MAQEFFINSQSLENKVRQLLPSQGGLGQGFDLSASTQIIPIIDLTESAEGSNLRQDLQKASSFNDITAYSATTGTNTIINNTGYFQIIGSYTGYTGSVADASIILNDGSSTKTLIRYAISASGYNSQIHNNFVHMVFLGAGHTLQISASNIQVYGSFRQIASIDGTLTDPT